MPRVHILPPDVISKIAAGEIIERPASVVKELLENALDAHADSIEIDIKNAGKTLIRVKDNGTGIERDDLDKIFLRHATSKIEKASDLESILSLGFRGEALYSVASIADIVLKTKTNNSDSGWEIHLRGGEKLNLRPVQLRSTGTEIEVNELFFNTPARKKFLKSDSTEIHQILNIVIPYALLSHRVRFKLTHQGKDLLGLSPSENMVERASQILNLETKNILEVKRVLADKNTAIHMVLGDINIKRARRDLQFIFVNNRPVQNRTIAFHINRTFRLIMPEETYPFFIINLTLPSINVDVNIHPTKREVKIKDEQTLCSILRSMCEETLMGTGQIKSVSAATSIHEPALNYPNTERHHDQAWPEELFEPKENTPGEPTTQNYNYPRTLDSASLQFYIPEDNVFTRKKDSLQNKFKNARYIGSFINKYLLFENGSSLLLVDQHAAQERIIYEQLIIQMEKGEMEVQNLLDPVLIKLSIPEMLAWEESKERIESVGFTSSEWGNNTIAIYSHPALIGDIEKTIRQLLSGENIAHSPNDEIARRACRASIMTGDRLKAEMVENQRQELLKCLDPFTCPHGRPTIIEIPETFLDKQFLRK